MDAHNFGVIMAGGVGSRFWPMSHTAFPKQFHDILGTGQTLIQMTFERLRMLCPAHQILVVTNAQYRDLVLEQLPDIDPSLVLCEPFMRNTAPCIAYANAVIANRDPEARMIVAPSDHLVIKEDVFVEVVNTALDQASETGHLVTLGIKPSRPDTGYGYIQFGEAQNAAKPDVRPVRNFTEKPNLETAEQFLASGDYYWNSGIFIWTLKSIDDAFAAYLPAVRSRFEDHAAVWGTPAEAEVIAPVYDGCENISIDYGIMEKAPEVSGVLADFGWSDLGTWGSLYTHLEHDAQGNGVVGNQVMLYECNGNVVRVPDDKLVVLRGLDNYIVVQTDQCLLVTPKKDEQGIKQIVGDVKAKYPGGYA
ncbi:MAG: mannose-1-phosphate guanylyltransferase [Flavobacteriales bacterium]